MTESTEGLPQGWMRRRVGDVLVLRNGYAFKASEWSQSGRPIIRIQNLKSDSATHNYYGGTLPDRFRAKPGDLLFAWSGTPGTSFGAHVWNGPEAWINQHIFRVDFSSDDFDRDFLKLALDFNLNDYISEAQGGVGLAHITKGKLNESYLIAPPLPIQRQIAVRVAEIAHGRASALNHLALAQRAIERFRQSVLTAAYREASTWGDANTQVPLTSVLREPLKNGYSAKPVNHETGFRVLTLTATTSGWFDPRHFKYTEEEFPPESPFWLTPGDIVIQRGNTAEYVGVPALYEGDPGEFLYPDLMIRARVQPEIDPRFAWYMLLAPQARNYLRDRATGSAGNMPKINQKVLADLPIPMPPVDARQAIIAKLDKALALTKEIRDRIDMAARHVDATSRAVLAKAFRGDLGLSENPN
ncbi:restriction endonuclease subunit S [Kribbella sp. NPDC002412]